MLVRKMTWAAMTIALIPKRVELLIKLRLLKSNYIVNGKFKIFGKIDLFFF